METSDDETISWVYAKDYQIRKKDYQIRKKESMGKFIETTKQDLGKAGVRVAGAQINKLLVKVVLSLLKKQGFSKASEVAVLQRFFATPMGSAFISLAAGQVLSFAPYLKDQRKLQIVAEELRINGYATAGNELIDFIQGNFFGDILNLVKGLPDAEEEPKEVKHRIASVLADDASDEEEKEVAQTIRHRHHK